MYIMIAGVGAAADKKAGLLSTYSYSLKVNTYTYLIQRFSFVSLETSETCKRASFQLIQQL